VTDAPRPPIPVAIDPGRAAGRSHLHREVDLDDGFLARLGSVCPAVDVSDQARIDAGRDWWPLALTWAVDGIVPARPAAVVRPTTPAEVAALLQLCARSGVPITAAGGRSGVCGASVPVFGGIALDLRGLAGLVGVDAPSGLVDVRAGTFGDVLEDTLGGSHQLTLGHHPQSIRLSTLGGWLACRSAGQYSTRYGKVEDLVVGLTVALADGRLIRTGGLAPRAAMGPDLTQLFVGSEGTLGIITEARLRAHPRPPAERRAAYSFPDFPAGLEACRRILRRGATPAVVRLYDVDESARSFDVDQGAALIVLDEGDPALIDAVMVVVDQECEAAARLDDGVVQRWLDHRDALPPLEPLAQAGIIADTIEVGASWTVLPGLYRNALAALTAIDATMVASAHQSHAYRDGGCLYFTFAGRPAAPGEGEAYYRRAWDAVMTATEAVGGAISHHHGVGLNRGRYLPRSMGPAFDVLAAVKATLDPAGVLNPGKLGLPSPFGAPPWP
jgi:alkyldihydroxyacetonephosphate synthase